MSATLQSTPPARGRGRGRGSLSYLSLQQSLDSLPPLTTAANPNPERREESQFEDAPGAYPARSVSPDVVAQSSSPAQVPLVGRFPSPPPTTNSFPPPPPKTPTTPTPNAAAAVVVVVPETTPPPPTPPPPELPVVLPPADVVVKNSAQNKTSAKDLSDQLKAHLPLGAEEVARSIHATCIADRSFCHAAAQCCQNLVFEVGGADLRTSLLRALQSDFKNRATIFEKSESDFLSRVSLLCEVFAVMRDGGGNPFLPLATPSVEYLSMMLQDFSLTNNASNVLAHNLCLVGPILSDRAPEKEQALIESVRQKILDEKTESLTRCRLMRVLELSLSSWQPLPPVAKAFYDSNLNNLQRLA